MWLKELQDGFIREFKTGAAVHKKAWVEGNVDRLNQQSIRSAAVQGLMQMLSNKIRSVRMEVKAIASAQSELPFDLPFAVSIDPDETRVKATSELTRDEMAEAIKLRTKNVRDAQLKLSEFVAASRLAEPFWDVHPDWTFGQCVAAYMAPANDNNHAVEVAA
ncbi:hypothetical protein O9X81_00215 [Agrobacterium salinitolerans]|uniref:hypothetical protein n=1 Tax=Agrobacterium salinitolerans TaxID=1183413 RepID=UPI0022B82C26|nr:hypothetical protein [Agrobacterium salinitolerans]MCZ7855032.1 hypothetical protein [Agrobacterium salinitolerans]